MKRKCIAGYKNSSWNCVNGLWKSENCTYDQSRALSVIKTPKHFFKVVRFLRTLLHRRTGIISSYNGLG